MFYKPLEILFQEGIFQKLCLDVPGTIYKDIKFLSKMKETSE